MSEKRIQNLVNAGLVTTIVMFIITGIICWKGKSLEPIVYGSCTFIVFVVTFVYSAFSDRIDRFQEKHRVFSAILDALVFTVIFCGLRILNGKIELKRACVVSIVFFIIISVINYRSICAREKNSYRK